MTLTFVPSGLFSFCIVVIAHQNKIQTPTAKKKWPDSAIACACVDSLTL